jgi:hypothetical protein
MIFGVTKSIAELFEGELILGNEEVKIEDFVIHSNAGKDARQYLASGFGLEKTEILVVGENDLYQKFRWSGVDVDNRITSGRRNDL